MTTSVPTERLPRWHPRRLASRFGRWTVIALLVAVGLLMVAPVYWAVSTSVVPLDRAFQLPPTLLPPTVTWENYARVFTDIPYFKMIFNSLKISTTITVGIIVISVLAAYAFAFLRFPGRGALFVVLLSAMMIPSQMTFIPMFVIMRKIGLVDSHWALILPALINVFSIFLLRQSFLAFPRELIDAARIDGASHWQIVWRVVVPNSLPVIAGIAVLQFQHYFNDFYWPLVVLFSEDKYTIPLGLVMLRGEYNTQPTTEAMAAISTVIVPLIIVFIVCQRWVTNSFVRAGLKG
jgi:multiple sugar transport system permease protein